MATKKLRKTKLRKPLRKTKLRKYFKKPKSFRKKSVKHYRGGFNKALGAVGNAAGKAVGNASGVASGALGAVGNAAGKAVGNASGTASSLVDGMNPMGEPDETSMNPMSGSEGQSGGKNQYRRRR